jgi:hypothetical protein
MLRALFTALYRIIEKGAIKCIRLSLSTGEGAGG